MDEAFSFICMPKDTHMATLNEVYRNFCGLTLNEANGVYLKLLIGK
jgi:hypothetical protein